MEEQNPQIADLGDRAEQLLREMFATVPAEAVERAEKFAGEVNELEEAIREESDPNKREALRDKSSAGYDSETVYGALNDAVPVVTPAFAAKFQEIGLTVEQYGSGDQAAEELLVTFRRRGEQSKIFTWPLSYLASSFSGWGGGGARTPPPTRWSVQSRPSER